MALYTQDLKQKLIMKKIIILFLAVLILGCSPEIIRHDYVKRPIKNKNCDVTIVNEANLFGIDIKRIGRIDINLGGLVMLKQDSATQILKREACSIDANFVNILFEGRQKKVKYSCSAEFYNIDFNNLQNRGIDVMNRDTLEYRSTRNLSWNDFKGVPQSSDTLSSKVSLFTTLIIKIREINAWLGYATYDINAVIFRDLSWVPPKSKTEKQLTFQQLIFDISKIYAIKAQNDLNERKINLASDKIEKTFQSYRQKMFAYQSEFQKETNYGQDSVALKKWNERIKAELKVTQKSKL